MSCLQGIWHWFSSHEFRTMLLATAVLIMARGKYYALLWRSRKVREAGETQALRVFGFLRLMMRSTILERRWNMINDFAQNRVTEVLFF